LIELRSATNLLHTMTTYFAGEKLEALVFIQPVGLLSLACGVRLLIDGFAERRARPYTAALEASLSSPHQP
jgi:hypothetical protein